MSVKRDIKFRVYLAFTGILVLALAIIAKAAIIQIKDGKSLRSQAEKAHTKKETLFADRGNIYTEDGTLLSATIPKFDLRVDFKAIDKDTFVHYIDTLSLGLSELFGDASAAEYKKDMMAAFRRKERYWLLKRNVPYYQYQAAREMPVFNKGKNKGGFIAEGRSKRANPYGMLAYRTIGLWRENAENIGLEQKFDSVLSGKPGVRIMRKTTGATWIPISGSEIDPINGQDIITTIDINVQDVAEHALLESMAKYNSQQGTAIVMEVATGKIKALANLGRQADGSYWEDFNYAMIPSEPGSTFKLMSLMALVDDGYVNIKDIVNTQNGLAVFGRQRVVDDHRGLGEITIQKAFAQSSNVAFAKLVAQKYGQNPMKYIAHLQKLKLDKKTGLDLNGERSPTIKTTQSKSWNKTTSLPWIAYGYESMITPLHTCMVYNGVANNGKIMRPYLVSAVQEYGLPIKQFKPKVWVEQMAKPATIKQLQEAMRSVVEEGTAKSIQSPYYGIAGKTGTAQVADKGISYSDGVRQGSFVGYFPYENPKYTIAVVIRSTPNGPYYGAVVAAPVFKAIADKLFITHIGGWGLPQDTIARPAKWIADGTVPKVPTKEGTIFPAPTAGTKPATKQTKATTPSGIPNVVGMGLKDALFLLETTGLKVSIKGSGRIQSQSLPPGSKVVKGQNIHLQLG